MVGLLFFALAFGLLFYPDPSLPFLRGLPESVFYFTCFVFLFLLLSINYRPGIGGHVMIEGILSLTLALAAISHFFSGWILISIHIAILGGHAFLVYMGYQMLFFGPLLLWRILVLKRT